MSRKGVRLQFRDIGAHSGASSVAWSPSLGTYVRSTLVNTGSDRLAKIEIFDVATHGWIEFDVFSQRAGDFDDNAGDAAVAVGDDGSLLFLLSAGDGGKDFEIRDGWAYYPPQLTGFPAIDGRTPAQFSSGIVDQFARDQIAAIAQAANNATQKAADAAGKANEMIKLVKEEVKKALKGVGTAPPAPGPDTPLTPRQQAQVDQSAKDAVWSYAPDVLYGAVVHDPNSPTRNIIRQEVHAALVTAGVIKE